MSDFFVDIYDVNELCDVLEKLVTRAGREIYSMGVSGVIM